MGEKVGGWTCSGEGGSGWTLGLKHKHTLTQASRPASVSPCKVSTSTGLLSQVVRPLPVTLRIRTCSVSGLDELELARALHRVGTLQPGSVVDCGLSGSIRRPCWNPIRPLLQAAPVQL